MSDIIRFVLSAVLTLGGLFCLLSGVIGVYRFRYALSRIHAAALFDTVGILLMVAGVIVATGFTITSVKMVAVVAFLWLTSPVSSHLIGRMEVTINDELAKDADILAPALVQGEKEPEASEALTTPETDEKEAL